jgi:hypothetical protein
MKTDKLDDVQWGVDFNLFPFDENGKFTSKAEVLDGMTFDTEEEARGFIDLCSNTDTVPAEFPENEGWNIFNGGTIQRDDEQDMFDNDQAAYKWVLGRGQSGSRPHRVAILIHARTMIRNAREKRAAAREEAGV